MRHSSGKKDSWDPRTNPKACGRSGAADERFCPDIAELSDSDHSAKTR